jgi:septal ring factor EnvC (AmiA/AmiB activator)
MEFLKTNFKSILFIILIVLTWYWLYVLLTPNIDMSLKSQQKIDSISVVINLIEKEQLKLNDKINYYNDEIKKIDNNITKIKNEKTIIKEYYHEQINNAGNFNVNQLDSFFSTRYSH